MCEELGGSLYIAETDQSRMTESNSSCMTSLCALFGAEAYEKEKPNSARSQAVENLQLIRPESIPIIDPSAVVATVVEPVE